MKRHTEGCRSVNQHKQEAACKLIILSFEMRIRLLILSLVKQRYNAIAILKPKIFFYLWKYILLIYLHKWAENRDTLTKVFNCVFYKFFLILPVYFYCTWCTKKFIGKIVYIIIRLHIHSLFCLLNLMVPACRPNFAEFAARRKRLNRPGLANIIFLSA